MRAVVASSVVLGLLAGGSCAQEANWERFFTTRDESNTWAQDQPPGGWWVTGIHQNVLANGKVLVTGWGRQAEFGCRQGNGGQSATSRRFGVSYVVDPADLVNQGLGAAELKVQPIWEAGEKPSDVLYCSGHASLPDGRKLFVGGSTYEQLGQTGEKEFGLDYARLFDPETETFSKIPYRVPFGTSWYPTVTMLPDQRAIVSRGFSQCCDGNQATALATLSFERLANGRADPWQLLLSDAEAREDIEPGIKDYTRLWLLQRPAQVGGLARQVATMGYRGTIAFLNTDAHRAKGERFASRLGATRPGSCAWDTTGAVLATGELLVMGGCQGRGRFIDLYDPVGNGWRSIDTGIERTTPSSTLLPDGTVLLMNGENAAINQDNGQGSGGDPRRPQVFDPFTGELDTLPMEPADGTDQGSGGQPAFRGYHNSVGLLFDGRVLVSGGVHKDGGIGCEQPNLRVFSPPYARVLHRPIITAVTAGDLEGGTVSSLRLGSGASKPLRVAFSSARRLRNSSGEPGTRSGAVLMSLSAFTHSYDQNQRFVPLRFRELGAGLIEIEAPGSPQAVPGDHMLFLVDEDGVPSVAKHVRVLPASGAWVRTVVFIFKETVSGQDMFIRGGHDTSVLGQYGGRAAEDIVYANTVGDKAANRQDGSLDWDSNSALSWTCSPGSSPWHAENGIFYASSGAGIDPENTWGRHWWKFEVYMRRDNADQVQDGFRDWFEFKAFIENADGSRTWEADIAHATLDEGPQPPVVTINHWARKGSVTAVRFGESGAAVYDLHEQGLPEWMLPYAPSEAQGLRGSTEAPAPGASSSPALAAGFGAVGALGVAAVALLFVRRRNRDASAPVVLAASSKPGLSASNPRRSIDDHF